MTAQERRIITRAAEANPADWREVACAQEALRNLLAKRKRIVHALPGQSRAAKRTEKKTSHREVTKAIREAVRERASGRCEAWCDRSGEALDHWEGGSGRRRQRQSVETTWLLCALHHDRRTRNEPSVSHWNAVREDFCARYGYPFVPHAEHLPVPGRFA